MWPPLRSKSCSTRTQLAMSLPRIWLAISRSNRVMKRVGVSWLKFIVCIKIYFWLTSDARSNRPRPSLRSVKLSKIRLQLNFRNLKEIILISKRHSKDIERRSRDWLSIISLQVRKKKEDFKSQLWATITAPIRKVSKGQNLVRALCLVWQTHSEELIRQ